MASIVEQTPYNEYTGNGVATVYPYEFQLLDAGDMVVRIDGAIVPDSDYTLSGVGVQAGGDVTFDTAPASGASVLLSREIVLEREADYQYNGDLREETLDRDLNRLWQALQGQGATLGGVLRLPYPEQAVELPSAEDRANKALTFDTSGNLQAVAPADGSATALAQLLADTTSASNGAALVAYSPALAYAAGVGRFLNYTFGRTDDEVAAGITPSSYRYFPGDPRRYGAVFDGSTDDAAAILAAFNVARGAGGGRVIFPFGLTTVISHGFNIPSKTTVYLNGCTIKATTTYSQGTIPTNGAIGFFEISHETAFGADPDITDIIIYGGGALLDGRRDEQTGTIPGYTGITIETSDSPVEADLWKIKRVLVRDLVIDRMGFDGWYVSGASDWQFINVNVTYALRVGSVVIASRRGKVINCDCGFSVGPNAGLPANMQGPSNSGDGWWNEPNNSWQSIDVEYYGCRSYFNYQSGFKAYNAGADSEVRILMFHCYAYQDCWDEVTQARRSAAAESGFRNSMNGTGAAKLYIEYNNCVADRFERSGFQIQRGAATGGDQVVIYNGCTARDCNLSNTSGNNRAPLSIPAGTGKTKIHIKGFTCIAPSTNTAGYGISVDGGENVTIEGDTYVGAYTTQRHIAGTGFATGITTVTAATYTVLETDREVIANRAGTVTLTLPDVLSWAGRSIKVRTITANTVVSATSNVVPLAGGAAGTAILAATAGRYATLTSDGTSWLIQEAN